MLIIVYRATKSQGKIRKISPVILLSAEEYRNPFSLQGRDMLLALFFLLYALICILILLCGPVGIEQAPNSPVFSIRRVQHFPGFIFVSRKLLYFEAQESVVLRFKPVLLCGAFRINFCNQLKAALPCRNRVPYPISLQLNYVHPHRFFMAVCSFFTHSMCQMSHSER